jgi:hypothetical protein
MHTSFTLDVWCVAELPARVTASLTHTMHDAAHFSCLRMVFYVCRRMLGDNGAYMVLYLGLVVLDRAHIGLLHCFDWLKN